jgi:hypothetical protein
MYCATSAFVVASKFFLIAVRAEGDDLIYLGLASILNAICNLKGVAANGLQPSLFKGFGNLPLTLTVRAPHVGMFLF